MLVTTGSLPGGSCVRLVQDVGGEHDGSVVLLDLRDPEALADELTAPWSSGRARILTWSGRGDREVSLGDLKIG